MQRFLKSKAAVGLIGAVLFTVTTAMLLRPERWTPPPASSVPRPGAKAAPIASWAFSNPEAEQLIAELKKEKAALAAREQQLNDLALRLRTEREEINQVTQTVHQLQVDYDQNLVRVREEETANLKKLAKLYAAMSADGAATILKEMLDDQVVRILAYMKESEAAPILEAVAKLGAPEAKRVAGLSERLRLTVRPAVTPITQN